MANENDKDIINGSGVRADESGAKAPRKKLNVVFRKQNSTTIKELPKHLKSAASMSERKTKGTSGESSDAPVRKKRPLPAGTKPVKPMAMSSAKVSESGEQPVRPKAQEAPAAVAETVAKTEEKIQAETVSEAAPAAQAPGEVKARESASAAVEAVPVVHQAAEGENEAAKPEIKKAEENIPVSAAAEPIAPETSATDTPDAHVGSKSEPGTAAAGKSTKSRQKAIDDSRLPKVKIVKSYADYDAAAVIAEASRQAKKESGQRNVRRADGTGENPGRGQRTGAQASGRPAREFTKDRGTGPRTARTARGETAGRSFAAGSGNQRSGDSRTSSASERRGRTASAQSGPDGSQRGGQASRGNLNQRGNQNQRGKTQSRGNRDSRKRDKYSDDLTAVTKNKRGAFIKPEPKQEKPEEEIKVITIPETLSIKDLCDKLKLQPSVIVKKLFLEGKMVTPNTDISYDEAESIAMDYDVLCEREVEEDVIAEILKDEDEDESKLVTRNPVVCVMGHVDHGKTSLLDAIRNTNVTSREAGGITQHIGASVVFIGDRSITFLDTPGHEAFTAMRLRGAQSTDIAVLVVAADDGVKPQTVEAINHAKAAGVEVIVAINKMDKEGANPDMVRNELSEYGLISEQWGGNTPMVEVSAKTGDGITDLLDMILLEADVMELKADPSRLARGLVIEAELDKGRGPVATVLVQKGTLRVGDNVVAGASYGKVRAMFNDKHKQIRSASPSFPAEILGLNQVPEAGEVFMAVKDEKEARTIAETFIAEHKKHMLEETRKKMNLEDLFEEIKAGNVKELPIIVKADVQGSVEAVRQSLGKLSNDEVSVNVIHSAVGNINESDVSLASASNAIIIGFNVKPDPLAKSAAEQEKVDVRLYKVIYQAIEDLEAALTGMLAPVYEPQNIGRVIVRQIFKSSGVGTIAGSYVTEGVVERGSRARLYRGDKLLFDGDIASLKRFKDEVKEVRLGFECGIVLDDFSDVEVDDTMEIYKMVQVPRN